MIEEIPINESHVFAFQISGKLNVKDYDVFKPKLERLLKKEGRISLLIKLENFDGWTLKAMWEDLKIGFKHNEDFLRIAFVGSSSFEKIMIEAGDLFLAAEIEHFDNESDAMSWLREVKNLAEKNEYIGYRHILVASDFSKYSSAALKKAVELAKPFDAKVTLLHATEMTSADVYPTLGELDIPVVINSPEFEKHHLKEIREQLLRELKAQGLTEEQVEVQALLAHPVDAIINYALNNNVDLIVMGSHGRRGLARLVGSSTNGVVNYAPCDVLTVV